ncbi:MAG TPA: N-acetyl-gamma-glutamyl-phosphate reductase, partial [Acidimicrobiales bacterium]|nr:N-acetyl-gamma-glutamyl-phosphate reductase [Acidimicrobiales bacterium]
MFRVGIIGGSGFTGAELLRLCAGHPDLHVDLATGDNQAGVRVADLYPSLAAGYPELTYAPYAVDDVKGLDLVFCGLPHGASQVIVPEVATHVKHVVDLAADFRLRDPKDYEQWYGEPHQAPDLLGDFAYGLPELHRDAIRSAPLVAAPGCYPTAATLALAPLVRAGLVD